MGKHISDGSIERDEAQLRAQTMAAQANTILAQATRIKELEVRVKVARETRDLLAGRLDIALSQMRDLNVVIADLKRQRAAEEVRAVVYEPIKKTGDTEEEIEML